MICPSVNGNIIDTLVPFCSLKYHRYILWIKGNQQSAVKSQDFQKACDNMPRQKILQKITAHAVGCSILM